MTESQPTLIFKRTVSATPLEVYEAWTQPDVIREWLAPGENVVVEVQSDVQVGGHFRIRSRAPDGAVHTIDGTYRELKPPRRILMTWSYSGPVQLLCRMETLLEVEMKDAPAGATAMTVTQTGFSSAEAAAGYGDGWPTCFDKLERATTREAIQKNTTTGGKQNVGRSRGGS